MPSSPVTGQPVAFPTWAARTLRRHTTAALRFGRWATEPGNFPAPRRLARSIGARCTLVMDLPHLDRLHQDLDAAHARWPDCAFLQNHRAAPALLERQAHEWSLADRVLVRSRFAARGHRDARPLPAGPASVQAAMAGPLTIRLAGWTSAALVAAGDVAGLVEATLRLTQRQPLKSWTAPPTPDTPPHA